jgi:hypothetical protein
VGDRNENVNIFNCYFYVCNRNPRVEGQIIFIYIFILSLALLNFTSIHSQIC